MLDISAANLAQISCRNSLGQLLYVVEHFGEEALPQLFDQILLPDTLISDCYQYHGIPLTLDYFKDINNWYSNEINLKLFNNLSKLGIDAFDTGYYVVNKAKEAKNYATVAFLQMLGPFGTINKINKINKVYNRTKDVYVERLNNNSGKVVITYYENCPHNEQVTRQNIGAYTAGLEVTGLQNIQFTVEKDEFESPNQTILHCEWLRVSVWYRLRCFLGKSIARIVSKSYLQSSEVIQEYHSNLLSNMETEISEKESQRKKSDKYYQQLLDQQQLKEKMLTQLVKVRTKELEASLKSKDELFENVSHELKTPLTLIIGRSEQLVKNTELPSDVIDEVNHINNNAQNLHHLVKQLLQVAEFKNTKIVKEPIEVVQQTQLLLTDLKTLAESENKKIQLSLDALAPEITLNLQQGAWASIVTNLLGNAVKYGEKEEAISVTLKTNENIVNLIVTSQGSPISTEHQDNIFQRFTQTETINEGQGLGLFIVKQLIEYHGGSITIETSKNSNSFIVQLPIKENQTYDNQDISINKTDTLNEKVVTEALIPAKEITNKSKSLPIKRKHRHQLLLVEDNAELSDFMVSALHTSFKVTAVNNGQAAINWLAKHKLPDLILSDVMMPVMDGYQLCHQLKNDSIYQNIPLFLLTAKSDTASVKKGFSLSADDYIAKPFNMDVLIAKITNQLATRDALKQQIKTQLLTHPDNTEISSEDLEQENLTPSSNISIKRSSQRASTNKEEELLNKVNTLLAKHFSNSEIKARDFASALFTSEKTLNRKLQAICGSSITELLREYRLNQAKRLLEQGDKPKEVCFDCGFNSMSYFSRCFKGEFGCGPSQVLMTL